MAWLKRYWGIHFLGMELMLSILGGVVFGIWVKWFGGALTVDHLLTGNKSAVYGTLASISGALLGFAITVLAVIIGYSTNEKFQFLRKTNHYSTLWKVLLSTIKALSAATTVMILGLVLDRESSPHHLILSFSVLFTLLSLSRLARCIWVLENVVNIITLTN
jgi:hypothetical protein